MSRPALTRILLFENIGELQSSQSSEFCNIKDTYLEPFVEPSVLHKLWVAILTLHLEQPCQKDGRI